VWRAEAAARDPAAVPADTLGIALAESAAFAAAAIDRGGEPFEAHVPPAIAVLGGPAARRAAENAASRVPRDVGDPWRWLALAKLPPADRYRQLRRSIGRAPASAATLEELLDAYGAAVLDMRDVPGPLPPASKVRRWSGSARVEEWGAFEDELGRVAGRRYGTAAEGAAVAARRLTLPDRDVAFEVLLDECVTQAPGPAAWRAALALVAGTAPEPADVFAARLTRTVLRERTYRRMRAVPAVAGWIAMRTGEKRLDAEILDTPGMVALGPLLTDPELREEVLDCRDRVEGRTARNWLKDLAAEGERASSGGRSRWRIGRGT
jgi:hypothetical protein